MTLAQIFNQLVKGYQKVKGIKPKGLDLIKIKQEALQRFKDMNKVVDMEGNVIDTSKGIMGGQQVGQKGMFDNIFARMQKDMGKNLKEVKTKNRPGVYGLDDYDITNMSNIKKEIIKTEQRLGNLDPDSPDFRKKAKELSDKIIALKNKMRDDKAMGGRIGLSAGGGLARLFKLLMDESGSLKQFLDRRKFLRTLVGNTDENIKARELEMLKKAMKEARENPGFEFPSGKELRTEIEKKIGPILLKDRKLNSDGGRIGLKEGEGIMKMASDPDPMSEADDISRDMFGKPYRELNEDELEQFREEMERLRNKFVSAPDPMDERNTVMENIAIQEFGKPLKDLSEDEIIQIEEMMEEMTKIDRGAPSITLADGGRAAFKDGKIAGFFKSLRPFSSKNKYTNQLEGILYGSEGLSEGLQLLSQLPFFAEGGRIGYKDGPQDPKRRTFMKAAAGLASLLPFGIGKGVKMAAPVVAKAAEISGPALAKLVETVMSAGKLISVAGKRVKEMVTKKKLGKVEVTEDIADGSYIIKKDGKEIYYKPGRQDESGGFDEDIIEVIEKRIEKAGRRRYRLHVRRVMKFGPKEIQRAKRISTNRQKQKERVSRWWYNLCI